MKNLMFVGLLCLVVITSESCARRVVVVAPPPPVVEVIRVAPSPRHVWVKGHYIRRGNKYVWVKGRYIVRRRY